MSAEYFLRSRVLVSVGEIARLAGVVPSAVSNWRKRHPDFPLPVEGDLFDQDAVLTWLEQRNPGFRREADQLEWVTELWSLLSSLPKLHSDDPVLLALQVIYVRSRAEFLGEPYGQEPVGLRTRPVKLLAELWSDLRAARDSQRRLWSARVRELEPEQPDLAQALTLDHWVDDDLLNSVVHMVSSLWLPRESLGEAATQLLRRAQAMMGIRAGWAGTPESLTQLWLGLLSPVAGAVYDPACGTAMFLAAAWQHRAGRNVRLFGQEINKRVWQLGYLHLALLGAEFELSSGDTLRDDRFRELRAARIALDPPIGSKISTSELVHDERWSYGVTSGSADWLWVQHIIHHLDDDGMAVVLTTPGALFRSGTEAAVRAGILRAGVLDAVIELPPGLYPGASIPTALLVFAADRGNRRGEVLFVNARQLGSRRRGKGHELESHEIARVVDTVRAWREGRLEPVTQFASTAAIETILENQASLVPSRYLELVASVTEIENEPIEARLDRFRQQLAEVSERARTSEHAAMRAAEAFVPDNEGEWPHVQLGDLLTARPLTGSRLDPEGEGRSYPFVESRLVSGGDGRLRSTPGTVTHGAPKGRLARRGDVLLISRGIQATSRIGCATVEVDAELAYSESLLRLSPDPERLVPGYLRLFLTSRQGHGALVAVTTGTTIANLRPDAVAHINIPLPPLAVQREILSSIDQVEEGMHAVDQLRGTIAQLYDTIREGVVARLIRATPG